MLMIDSNMIGFLINWIRRDVLRGRAGNVQEENFTRFNTNQKKKKKSMIEL